MTMSAVVTMEDSYRASIQIGLVIHTGRIKRRRSKRPRNRQHRLIEHFVDGTSARTGAQQVGVNRGTTALYYRRLRKTIVARLVEESLFGRVPAAGKSRSMNRTSETAAKAAGRSVVFGYYGQWYIA